MVMVIIPKEPFSIAMDKQIEVIIVMMIKTTTMMMIIVIFPLKGQTIRSLKPFYIFFGVWWWGGGGGSDDDDKHHDDGDGTCYIEGADN